MAKGWAELLKEVRRLRAREELDLEAVWDAFEELASGSQHTSTLRIALRLGETLSASQRYLLALIVMRLLAPVEWPEEWASVRPRLVTGIAHLLREIDPRTEDSFSALLELQADAAVQAVGHVMLQIAHDLLSKPCRRSDLRQAAALCNLGNTSCLMAYRSALQRRGDHILPGPLLDARTRYVVAFEHYAQAARELNDACGVVLFRGLDARLDPVEG